MAARMSRPDSEGMTGDESMLEKNWRDLIKPKALDVDKETLTPAYGKFVAKPLEARFRPDSRQFASPRAALFASGRSDHCSEDRRRCS